MNMIERRVGLIARCADKNVHGSPCAADAALRTFETGRSGRKYQAIGNMWRRVWQGVIPLPAFPLEVRRIFDTFPPSEQQQA
jgi:transposase-like protein